LRKLPPSHVLLPAVLNDLFVEISIEQGRRIDAVGFDNFKRLREEGGYGSGRSRPQKL